MRIVTRADHPELHEKAAVVFRERQPEFIFHDDREADRGTYVEENLWVQHKGPAEDRPGPDAERS